MNTEKKRRNGISKVIVLLLAAVLFSGCMFSYTSCSGDSAATGKQYTVSFDYNDDITAKTSIRVNENGRAEEPSVPVREGYVFSGWYSDSAFTVKYDFSQNVTKNLLLYAKWSKAIKVTFVYNDGVTVDLIKTIAAGETVETENPTRADYKFNGWFKEATLTERFDFSAPVTEDISLYAGWSATKCTITLRYNDDVTTDKTETLEAGSIFTKPADPVRDGYKFDGWYTNAELTNEFNFSNPVTDSLILYASWIEEGISYKTVTLHYNDGMTENGRVKVKENGRLQTFDDPAYADHEFLGWFTDPEYKQKFIFSKKITEDTDLYAKWGKIYLFEAEDTNITGIVGKGYSGDATGSDIIGRGSGASNGYYITFLYKKGIEIVFSIVSSAAVDDAVVWLSLSAEYANFTITGETYQVSVNDEPLSYEIAFTDVPEEQNAPKREFTWHKISVGVSLKEGVNTVKLLTNNSEPLMGTMAAKAPMVDCLKIVSSSVLSWNAEEGYPYDNTSMLS